MKYYFKYNTLVGSFYFIEEEDQLIAVQKEEIKGIFKETPLLKKAFSELEDYLEGKRKNFTIPLNPKGTAFQKQVWHYLQTIPYGETKTYQEIAIALNNPHAARAIGSACHVNPIPFFIPCHRVIGKNHELIGYALGLPLKKQLLIMEKKRQNK